MSSAGPSSEAHLHYEAEVAGHSPIAFSVSEIADADHRSTTSVWRIPSDISNYHATHALDQAYRHLHGNEHEAAMFAILRFAHPEEYRRFKGPIRQHPFLQELGYNRSQRTRPDARGRRVMTERFTYPTAQTLNGFMGEAFGDDGGARFEAYDGGEYSPEEFVEALVKRGTILLASQPPYSAHDAGDHAIGWIGFDPAAFQVFRTASETVLKEDKLHGLQAQIAYTADNVSGEMGTAILAHDPSYIDLPQAYSDLQRYALWPINNALVTEGITDKRREDFEVSPRESAKVTTARYRQADEFVQAQRGA